MVGTAKPKKLKAPKNVPKKKGQCWTRTKIIVGVSFLVGLLAISTLYFKNYSELTGLEILEKQKEIDFDQTKIKASSIVGTVWKDKGELRCI